MRMDFGERLALLPPTASAIERHLHVTKVPCMLLCGEMLIPGSGCVSVREEVVG